MLLYLSLICGGLILAVVIFLRQPPFGKEPTGERLERIKRSPNFRDGKFQNPEHTPDLAEGVNMLSVLWSFLTDKTPRQVPADPLPSVRPEMRSLDPKEDALIWFGHSSYFLQTDGKRLLVDPVFNGHASPVSFAAKSFPGTAIVHAADLPDLDLLVITHDHWDHLDYPTIKKLTTKVRQVVCPLGVGAHLEFWGYKADQITELDWHESVDFPGGFTIRATPARHFSGRGFKRNTTLWASFVLQTPSRRIFLGGDSGYGKHFADIGEQYGPFDLAILEDGQYNQAWIYIHMLPEQVLQAARDLNARSVLPVHHSKFSLAMHAWDDPLVRITEANTTYQLRLLTPKLGEKVLLADTAHRFVRWWESLR